MSCSEVWYLFVGWWIIFSGFQRSVRNIWSILKNNITGRTHWVIMRFRGEKSYCQNHCWTVIVKWGKCFPERYLMWQCLEILVVLIRGRNLAHYKMHHNDWTDSHEKELSDWKCHLCWDGDKTCIVKLGAPS
jgi:hypothetical protein